MLRSWITLRASSILVVPFALALSGCNDSTGPASDLLTVDLQLSPAHFHAFETDVIFTVTVTDRDGAEVRDFNTLRAELGVAGTENWTKQVPLLFDGAVYTGSTRLTAAGSFDLRVVGQRPDQAVAVEIHRSSTPLAAVRPHFDAGGYRVEFETHSGEYPVRNESITFRFLVMEDGASPRPPVAGLSGVTIRCTQGSAVEVHDAVESPAGTYTAAHTFSSAGEATAQIEFTGLDSNPAVVQVPLIVE
jgi:hypothetical protein